MIDGILYRVRTGIPWRDLPERFGPWKMVHGRHRLWSADGTRSGCSSRSWQSLHAHLVEVVKQVRDWAAQGAASPPSST